MAHFLELDENNVVINGIVVHNNELLIDGIENEQKGIDFCVAHYGGTWIQTSYNSRIRGTYGCIGYSYNADENIFIAPQPYPSWHRVGSFWEAPTPMPSDGMYSWNEETLTWDEV